MSTGINFLDEVWNPISGCQGKGCKCRETCWARDMVTRFPQIHGWDPDTEDGHVRGYSPLEFSKVQFHPDRLEKPLHWRKLRRIGVCFMGDLFDEGVAYKWIDKVWQIARDSYHTYFFLTKQPEKMIGWWLEKERWSVENVFWGVSITDQEDADRMIPELLRIPGKHWVSYEPCLSNIDLTKLFKRHPTIDLLIMGCESGPNRRHVNINALRSIRYQAWAAGVLLWVKQMEINGKVTGDMKLFPEDLQVRQLPEGGKS